MRGGFLLFQLIDELVSACGLAAGVVAMNDVFTRGFAESLL